MALPGDDTYVQVYLTVTDGGTVVVNVVVFVPISRDDCIAWAKKSDTLKYRLGLPDVNGMQAHPDPIPLHLMEVERVIGGFTLIIPSSQTITCSCCHAETDLCRACTVLVDGPLVYDSLVWEGLVCGMCAHNLKKIWNTNESKTSPSNQPTHVRTSMYPRAMDDDEDWFVPDIFAGEIYLDRYTSPGRSRIQRVGDELHFTYEAIHTAMEEEATVERIALQHVGMLNWDHKRLRSRVSSVQIPCRASLPDDIIEMIAILARNTEQRPVIDESQVFVTVPDLYPNDYFTYEVDGYDGGDDGYYEDSYASTSFAQRDAKPVKPVKQVPGAKLKAKVEEKEFLREEAKIRRDREKLKGKKQKERKGKFR